MREALGLAAKARGRTHPNPMVGAVIVKGQHVIGVGHHKKAGSPHAEVVALRKAKEQAKGATLYVTLEPCCHHGRTPPCTEAVIESGIREVYIGTKDPDLRVQGRGVSILRKAGIKVHSGLLKKESQKLNEVYFKNKTEKKPFVILKSAFSLDGKTATETGESQWITGEKARRRVHEIRNEVDAILVGAGTVLRDDPRLTTRLSRKNVSHPIRVILDTRHQISISAKVFDNAKKQPVIYVSTAAIPPRREAQLKKKGVKLLTMKTKNERVSVPSLLSHLMKEGVGSLLLEGGSSVNASFLKAKEIDKVLFFVAPKLIGGLNAKGVFGGAGIEKLADAYQIENISVMPLGQDWMIEGYL